jgi:hypothetical protein
MRPINVEITIGHNVGVSSSYYRATDNELVQDYLKAIPQLTVTSHVEILEKQITELTKENED